MRALVTLLSVGVLLCAGCRSARREPAPAAAPVQAAAPAAVPSKTEPSSAVPSSTGPLRLRYYDVQDFPIQNGILIMRGTQPQLRAIDEHLSSMRRILGDAKARAAERPLEPVKPKGPKLVVQIHAVADIVAALSGNRQTTRTSPQEDLLAVVRKGLGPTLVRDAVLRFQGESALVVKAPSATHDRIAEILDEMRAELKRQP